MTRSRSSTSCIHPGTSVEAVMSAPPVAVTVDTLARDAARLMDRRHILHLPVVDLRRTLLGLVGYRDLLHLLATASGPGTPVVEIMHDAPLTVTPETGCLEAMRRMHDHDVGCLPVVRHGHLLGMLTSADFVRLSAGLLDAWLRDRHGSRRPASPGTFLG